MKKSKNVYALFLMALPMFIYQSAPAAAADLATILANILNIFSGYVVKSICTLAIIVDGLGYLAGAINRDVAWRILVGAAAVGSASMLAGYLTGS